MNKQEFLDKMDNKGLKYSVLGSDIIRLLEQNDFPSSDLDYKSLYTFINQPATNSNRDYRKIISWIEDNIEEEALVEDLYYEFYVWALDESDVQLSGNEFGRLIARETNYTSVPKYRSELGQTKRVYVKKD